MTEYLVLEIQEGYVEDRKIISAESPKEAIKDMAGNIQFANYIDEAGEWHDTKELNDILADVMFIALPLGNGKILNYDSVVSYGYKQEE